MAKGTTKTSPAQPKTTEERELEVSIEKLRRSCDKLYGISLSTFDGATAGLPGKKYSPKEMKAIIDEFLAKEVK